MAAPRIASATYVGKPPPHGQVIRHIRDAEHRRRRARVECDHCGRQLDMLRVDETGNLPLKERYPCDRCGAHHIVRGELLAAAYNDAITATRVIRLPLPTTP